MLRLYHGLECPGIAGLLCVVSQGFQMVSPSDKNSKIKVYVSYCGADSEFADRLIKGLKKDDRLEVSRDPDNAIDEWDWKARIGALIDEASVVVVVLSPDAAQSCEWEVERAEEYSKRIVPVLCKPLREAQMPGQLSEIRPVNFTGGRKFSDSLRVLVSTLKANADWLREHTELLVKARTWEEAGYPYHQLLSSEEVVQAKIWALSRPDDAPKPTDLHITYVCVSEAVETARQLAEAERQEAEVVAMLDAAKGSGFARLKSKMLMAAVYILVIAALVSSSGYLVAKYKQIPSPGSAIFTLPFKNS